jgi:hypothetical protein
MQVYRWRRLSKRMSPNSLRLRMCRLGVRHRLSVAFRASLFSIREPRSFPNGLTVNAAQPIFCTPSCRGLNSYGLNLKTHPSVEGEADNKTRAGRVLNPHVTAVVENSLAGEREPKAQPILFAGGYERFEYLIANLARNSGPRILYCNQHAIAVSRGLNANLSAARHRFKRAFVIRLKNINFIRERGRGNSIFRGTSSKI